MQTPTTLLETYQLVERTRQETKEAGFSAIQHHIKRTREVFSQPEHPHNKGYIAALEFAATLVKFS
jgi:hypothetical protein